jgi:hypothetical protein
VSRSAAVNEAIQHSLHPLGRNSNADLGSLRAYHDRRVAENSHYKDARLSLFLFAFSSGSLAAQYLPSFSDWHLAWYQYPLEAQSRWMRMWLLQLIVMLAHFPVFIICVTTADLLPSSSSKNR